MFDFKIQEYFFFNENGLDCRFSEYEELNKRYSLSDLLSELRAALEYDRKHPGDDLFRAASYVYLYAFFHHASLLFVQLARECSSFIESYEKANRRTLLERLLNRRRPPAEATARYHEYKTALTIFAEAQPLLQFNLSRSGNYDTHREQIRAKTNQLNELLSHVGRQVPSVVFELMDYMDRVPAPR